MSTIVDRPKSRSTASTALSRTLPQVNLLPPEVRAARGLRTTKRWLLIGLGVTVLVAIGAWGLALIDGAGAAVELTQAQDDTARLQSEAAKYAEVPQVLGALHSAEAARQSGMASDVQWKSYVDAITAVLPDGVNIDTIAMTLNANEPTTAVPLQQPSVGQIQFTARALALPNSAAWIDALNGVPGFTDAWVSSAAVTEDEHGTYYQVSATVQISDSAFTHRFDPQDGEG